MNLISGGVRLKEQKGERYSTLTVNNREAVYYYYYYPSVPADAL